MLISHILNKKVGSKEGNLISCDWMRLDPPIPYDKVAPYVSGALIKRNKVIWWDWDRR